MKRKMMKAVEEADDSKKFKRMSKRGMKKRGGRKSSRY